jgi:putative ATP-binding cassette transporter
MHILHFLKRASRRDIALLLLLTAIAGLANALLVVVVNDVAGLVARGRHPNVWWWLTFVAAFAVYYASQRFALLRANVVIEGLLKKLRLDVVDKLRQSELSAVDRVGRGELMSLLSHETTHLSVTFPILVDGFQQTVLLVVSLSYLAYLSTAAFIAFLVSVAVGIAGYLRINQSFRGMLRDVASRQAQMLDAIGDMIRGGKELRLNTRKSDSVFAAYRTISRSAEALLTASGEHWAFMILLSAGVTYFLLGVVVFVFPQYAGIEPSGVFVLQLVPILLFCLGPLQRIVAQSPMFARADVGLQNILEVERQLAAAGAVSTAEARSLAKRFRDFEVISYTRMSFSHRDTTGAPVFTSGPWDLTLNRGETVFLVGGNGSGKSTALRMITGLYQADEGHVAVNGSAVEGRGMAGVREQFSAIFSDFHLCDRLYGLEQVDAEEVNRLIDEMGLGGKVSFVDGRFTDLNLSTGQRKRLALIVAVLEDRPIYVFDEWSAEQDAHFREEFYTRILPSLKARGKTVIAVTHDERFWRYADRVIRLDLGRVAWEHAGSELGRKS